MKKLYYILLPLLATVFWTGCSEEDEVFSPQGSQCDFLDYSIQGYSEEAIIDAVNNTIYLQLPQGVTDGTALCPEFTVSEGATVTINRVEQVSGAETMDFSDLVLYTVTASDQTTYKRWQVTVTNNPYTSNYGMGNFLTAGCSNDGDNPDGFYLQQQHTGTYANDNCGPACAAMALRWADPTYTGSVEDARQEIPVSEIDGGTWWYPRDIYNYLNNHGVQAYYQDFTGASYDGYVSTVCGLLDEGNLAISCLNSTNLSEQKAVNQEYHTHKYYSGGSGHFLLIKGYRVVNNVTWLEVHDPWGLDKKYTDGSYMGANRYYLASEVATSVDWNIWTIVVPPLN